MNLSKYYYEEERDEKVQESVGDLQAAMMAFGPAGTALARPVDGEDFQQHEISQGKSEVVLKNVGRGTREPSVESETEGKQKPSAEPETEGAEKPSAEPESESVPELPLESESQSVEEIFSWIEFEPLPISSYTYEEKPDLQELFLQFPTKLKAVDEEGTALSIPVYEWECEEDYERTELAEYLFYPEIDREKWEFDEETLPSILVTVKESEKEMELAGYGAGLKVTVTADAGVLPAGTKLRVIPVKPETRIEELREAIEENESGTGASQKVEELIVLDLTLLKDGEGIQPDTKKGGIYVSFERMDRSASGTLEKEDAIAQEDRVSCSVEHFSEFAVAFLQAQTAGTGPYLVDGTSYQTLADALTAV